MKAGFLLRTSCYRRPAPAFQRGRPRGAPHVVEVELNGYEQASRTVEIAGPRKIEVHLKAR